MRDADILLLIDAPGRRIGIPAKLFEYFGARRPILALAHPQGDVAWALRRSGVLHRLASPTDPAQIDRALTELLAELTSCERAPAQPVWGEFTRARLAAQLADFLNQKVGPPGAPFRACASAPAREELVGPVSV